MPTLDHFILEENYNLTLFCHSSRIPDVGLVQKLAESLQLARKMVSDANVQLESVIQDSWENKFQPNPKTVGAQPYKSEYPVAVEAAKYHLKLTEWGPTDRVRVSKVMEATNRGLNGPIILSDVLGLYTVDLYKVFRGGLDIQDAMRVQPGKYRKFTAVDDKGVPQLNVKEGYVKLKEKGAKRILKSIHIEFSLASIYPRAQMARIIVHEATHKFAGTIDVAYCCEGQYLQTSKPQRISNADSYTYVVLSIYGNQLIKDQAECFRVIPQYGPPEWEHAADKALYGRGRVFGRLG
jgi:hypothetical protein